MNSKSFKMLIQKQLIVLINLLVQYYGLFEASSAVGDAFEGPSAVLEAFEPRGFRASILALKGVEDFYFYANVNRNYSSSRYADIVGRGRLSKDGRFFTFNDPELSLRVGDFLDFRTSMQYEKQLYLLEDGNWRVEGLQKSSVINCESSKTYVMQGRHICSGDVIFEEVFYREEILTSKWVIEQYIPFLRPNYEFNYYDNDKAVLYVNNDTLKIKPRVDDPVNEQISFRDKCTRQNIEECYETKINVKSVHPISSARLVTIFKFRYGIVEVRAKLPAGDWMFPQIYLEHEFNPNKTIWIAYARGNINLKTLSNVEIGGRTLYAGPVESTDADKRETYLKTKTADHPFSSTMRYYSLKWTEDEITLSVDDAPFGTIDNTVLKKLGLSNEDMALYKVVLGVGIAGINDFPDNCKSGNYDKPWKNLEVKNIYNFYNKRQEWGSSWQGNKGFLEVDDITVTAL